MSNKVYQVYTITNIKNGKVFISNTNNKVNPETNFFTTNKALYDDLMIFDKTDFIKTVIATANTRNECKQKFREILKEFRSKNIQLYNDMCIYGFVYLTTYTKTGQKYIGQRRITGNSKKDNEYFGSGNIIRNIIKKYGKKYLTRKILQECNSEDELNNAERYWIKKYNAVEDDLFFNIAEGGNFGDTWSGRSEEDKKKFSERIRQSNKTRKLNPENYKGNKNPAFGRHWYKDEVNHQQYYLHENDPLISQLNLKRGMYRTQEHNEKIGKALKGKKKNYICPATGKRWMYSPTENKEIFISKNECEHYLNNGYEYGMKKCRNTINNKVINHKYKTEK